MRVGNSAKHLILGNVHLISYCNSVGIDINKLKQCNIEKMGDKYVFVLSKFNAPKSKSLIPLDVDIATQPDIVLIMDVDADNEKVSFETTSKTIRVLNI